MEADRILDAAGELFAERGVAAFGMKDIARAAGCSRATLYRYFDNREALHIAFVHREARAVGEHVGRLIAGIRDPRERLLAGMTHALARVRGNPSLSAWFTRTSAGTEAAESSAVVAAMTAGFLRSLGEDAIGEDTFSEDAASADRRARWLVRVLTSLLLSPGRDADDERITLEQFVLPVMIARTAPA